MVEMAKLIDNAVSQKPKGIVITLPDAAALGKSVKAAIAAGIPVISMNSGSDDYASLGISAHVGQTEFEAGVGGGQKMKAAGGKKPYVLTMRSETLHLIEDVLVSKKVSVDLLIF